MRKLFVFTLILAFTLPLAAQNAAEVHNSAVLTALVGRGEPLPASLHVGPNLVRLVARHCKAYASTTFTGHWWWKKSRTVIDIDACNADPSTVYADFSDHNLVTNAGFTMIEKAISDTATQPASCNYLAFANDTSNTNVGTVAVTDTALASSGTGSTEITDHGLARAIGTFTADSPGSKQYTVAKVFTTTTGSISVNKAGLFNAASTGTMCYEVLFTQITLNGANSDTLTATWTSTLS